jgi:putative MATE family efflux protein
MALDPRLLRTILRLGTPVVLGMLGGTIQGLVDLAMVGRLGAAEMAAVGLATNLLYIAVRAVICLGQSVQAMVSRRVGEGLPRQAGAVARTGHGLGLLLGLPLTVLAVVAAGPLMDLFGSEPAVSRLGAVYIRSRAPEILFVLFLFVHRGFFEGLGRTGVPLVAGALMLSTNIFLNWVLIFGHLGAPALGVQGAGLASALAAVAGAVCLAGLGLRREFVVGYDLRPGLGLDRALVARLLRITWPNALRTTLVIGAFSILLAIIGRIGTLELAASNGVVRITSFSFMPAVGVGTAAGVLVGQALGRGDRARARSVGHHAVLLSCLFMGTMGLLFLTVPELCLRLFTDDPRILATGAPVQRLLGLVQLLDAVGLTLAMAMMGAGSTLPVMLGDVGTGYLIFLPTAWLLGLHSPLGLLGAWIGLLAWFTAFAGVMVWLWRREGWARVQV